MAYAMSQKRRGYAVWSVKWLREEVSFQSLENPTDIRMQQTGHLLADYSMC